VIERAVYRARQFFRALTAPLAGVDLGEAGRVLTPKQRALFLSMPPADQRHGLEVYRALQARGEMSPDLLAAALLHDVGKTAAPLPLWARAAVVLLERFAPHLLERLGREGAGGWRRSFAVYRCHAAIGAELVAQAGGSPLTAALIRRHHEPPGQPGGEEERLLALLQEVDEGC